MGADRVRFTFCCNPFKKKKHSKITKNLRSVTEIMCKLGYGIVTGMKICGTCRITFNKTLTINNQIENIISDINDLDVTDSGIDSEDSEYQDSKFIVTKLNAVLEAVGQSPVKTKRIRYDSYRKEKKDKIKKALIDVIFSEPSGSVTSKDQNDESEMLQQLKEKFKISNDKNEKFLILTVLPKSWSCQRIQKEFGVSFHMARKSKQLVEEKGILSVPDIKARNKLPDSTLTLVKQFYLSDEISKQMPGLKDTKSVKLEDGTRELRQKKMLMANLDEIYVDFKILHPVEKIGFSKFAELKPPECVLAGDSGTHSVCVCTIHQNVKLIVDNTRIKEMDLFEKNKESTVTYRDFLNELLCTSPTPDCFLNECNKCPGTEVLAVALEIYFEIEMIENITVKQWIKSKKGYSLETITKNVSDFVDYFCDLLHDLNRHDFIAKQQSKFYACKKKALREDEILVGLDFAENYSFVLQEAISAYHWSTPQATVHPFVVYYKENNQLNHKSFVMISDCLNHDTALVYTFQKKLITFLKSEDLFKNTKKIIYFSDGCGGQYKNCKNFKNLCLHQKDFGIKAEWHFFATSHGKSACDGVGGTVKRLAKKATLQGSSDQQIRTPLELYDWANKNIKGINFIYCTADEYETESENLKTRFETAKTLPGTQKHHSFIPLSETSIATKFYSFSNKTDVK